MDAVIFQKVYYQTIWRDLAKKLRESGVIVALDLCDPVWLQGGRGRLREMLEIVDFAVAPTAQIRDWLGRFVPAYIIQDRFDLSRFPQRWTGGLQQSEGLLQAVWYGYSANYDAVREFLPVLAKHEVVLTTVSDRPYPDPDGQVGFVPWSNETVNDALCLADFVINPKGSEKRFPYKSPNKTTQARIMGVPVAHNEEELVRLLDLETRKRESAYWLAKRDMFSIRHSVSEWLDVLEPFVMRFQTNVFGGDAHGTGV